MNVQIDWHVGEETYPNEASAVQQTLPQQRAGHHRLNETWVVRQVVRSLMLITSLIVAVASTAPTQTQESRFAEQRILHEIRLLEWQLTESSSSDRAEYGDSNSAQNRAARHDDWLVGQQDQSSTFQASNGQIIDLSPINDYTKQNHVIATVQVAEVDDSILSHGTYYEKRIYRNTTEGWKRITLTAEMMGPKQVFATNHLRFEFYALNEKIVRTVADQLEAIYVDLRTILDLPTSTNHEKMRISIVLDDMTGLVAVGNQHEVTSPMVARVPEGFTDETFLSQRIVERMTYTAVREAASLTGKPYQYRWERLAWALDGWLQHDLLGGRSLWHHEAARRFNPTVQVGLPARLNDIVDLELHEWPDRAEMMKQYMVAESVISYGVKEFGRNRLSLLPHSFGLHSSWTSFIPAVFDVSVEEFETGWNQYLLQLDDWRVTAGD